MKKIVFLLTAILLTYPRMVAAQSVRDREQAACQNIIVDNDSDREIFSKVNNYQPQTRLELSTSANWEVAKNTRDNNTREKTANTEPKIAIAGIPIPSLWWAKEQFDPFGGRLVKNWLTYPQIKQIDLTVNWQLWTLLDYLGRYRFINQFGTVAREYGYSLRIFNQQQQCLALYEYNDEINPPKWEIIIESSGQDSLQVEPTAN